MLCLPCLKLTILTNRLTQMVELECDIFHLLFIVEFTLKDAKELDQLINYLINKEDSEGVALLGHSTGCQVICYFILVLTILYFHFSSCYCHLL